MRTENRINSFIELISNILEAYTVILFLTDEKDESLLHLSSFCSLSRSINKKCIITSGEGIVGWVLKEKKSVLASHFDKRDATTLKFYEKDEKIKSLLAIPLPEMYGVLYVDSKKSYIFTEEKEKILIQMSNVLLAILKTEKELAEKKLLEFLLTLSLNVNELLSSNTTKDVFVEEFLSFFCDRLNLHSAILVIENEAVFWCSFINEKIICEKIKYDFFDRYGFAGWVLKNKKELYLDNISSSDKSFVINKNENYSPFYNFLGFSLSYNDKAELSSLSAQTDKRVHETSILMQPKAISPGIPLGYKGKQGVICFIKKNKEKWIVKEKKTVEFISQLFFKEYFHKHS